MCIGRGGADMEPSDSLRGFVSWHLAESFPRNMIQSSKCENSGCQGVGDQDDLKFM